MNLSVAPIYFGHLIAVGREVSQPTHMRRSNFLKAAVHNCFNSNHHYRRKSSGRKTLMPGSYRAS
ncbi:MAG: hypothetical protein WB870_05465, partial [Gallionellaceae bacterium]